MFAIYAVNLEGFKDEKILEYLFKYVSEEKSQRLSKFKITDDKKRGVLGELLVRYLICDNLKIKNNEINFTNNKYGKPFIKDYIGLEYNISHSNQLVVCAVGDYGVGIDIEYIKNVELGAANYLFAKHEYEVFNSLPEHKKLEYFYSVWTLKESFIKAKGLGLSIPMNSFSINRHLEKDIYCMYDNCKYYFREYSINRDYKLSICSRLKDFPDEIKVYSFEEFFNLINHKLICLA
ncbi:4'-phosphopantetheinyl transferase superfamily protein [Clostridium sp.]|jgi:4'-phosphopantetheinyl transferase|uniref:4'-phosphopantetheinyl transferase family protein n=1 Tax=Clostridium sp. TaxID=1506 RepID=UPI002587F509|nr:4'-phosphopantetheinyl transferase superfamily protein [Clostridium sp.]MDF2503344.1 phosphopantetheine--protein transferase [Clostridium sp.]